MPTGTKGGYDKARETFARDKDNSDKNGLLGRIGDAGDRLFNNTVGGIKSGIGNLFSGGNKDSGPSSSMRPQARPEYVVKGTGKDAVYTNTRTGKTAYAPDYSGFSMRGLTSSDPGNYMRNQEAAQRYAAMPQRESENRGYMNRDKGIASLAPTVPAPAPVTLPTTPTTPVAPTPVGVPTTGYAGYDSSSIPAMGYGSAFAGLSQPMANPYGGMNLMDIFSMYPELQYM
jgi:hypothetical protein